MSTFQPLFHFSFRLAPHIGSLLITERVLHTLRCPSDLQASTQCPSDHTRPSLRTRPTLPFLLSPTPFAPTMAIKVGDKAPEFTLKDQSGNAVEVKFGSGQPSVLFFYPKDNTPG